MMRVNERRDVGMKGNLCTVGTLELLDLRVRGSSLLRYLLLQQHLLEAFRDPGQIIGETFHLLARHHLIRGETCPSVLSVGCFTLVYVMEQA